MKVGSIFGVHVAVLCVFALTQGCITNEADKNRVAGARRTKGPWKHVHKGKTVEGAAAARDPYGYDNGMGSPVEFEEVVIETTDYNTTPEPAYTPLVAAPATTEVYIVQKGDMLSQLAIDFDTTVPALVNMNGLANPDVLYVGQELRVPAGHRSSSATTTKSSGSVKKGGSYEIQKGDTLSEIALAAGVAINDLRSLNNIKDDKIFAGEVIYIPSYGKVPSTSRSRSAPKKAAPAPAAATTAAPEPSAATPVAPPPMSFAPVEPVAESVGSASAAAPATMSYDVVEEVVLYPGETLDDVARQYSVSVAELMRLNNISDASQLVEGQRIRVPVPE